VEHGERSQHADEPVAHAWLQHTPMTAQLPRTRPRRCPLALGRSLANFRTSGRRCATPCWAELRARRSTA
jgi:hypothetical protein